MTGIAAAPGIVAVRGHGVSRRMLWRASASEHSQKPSHLPHVQLSIASFGIW